MHFITRSCYFVSKNVYTNVDMSTFVVLSYGHLF